MKKILVTGVAGGLGRAIATHLIGKSYEVVGVDVLPCEFDLPITTVARDIRTEEVDDLLQACDVVVHTAARLDLSRSYEELHGDNVATVEKLVASCDGQHFVHISDGVIYEAGRGLRTESDPRVARNAYERTKIEAEAAVTQSSCRWTVLRPALLYGPGCASMSAGLVTLPPIFGEYFRYPPGLSGGNRANWAHVEDVAAAVQVVIEQEAIGKVYNVADDTPLGFGEALSAIAESYGFALGPKFPFPNPTMLSMFVPVVDRDYVESGLRSVLNERWSRIVAKHGLTTPLRPKVDRSVVSFVSEDNVLDNSALKGLGWEPHWRSFVDGIPATIEWYQQHQWVPEYTATDRASQKIGYGFCFEHRFEGIYNGEPITLEAVTRLPNVSRADLAGEVDFEILLDGEVMRGEGTADFAFVSKRELSYQFGFEIDGEPFRAVINAKLNPLRPISSLRKWSGTVIDKHGATAGKLTLNIDFTGQAVDMLTSFTLLS